MIRLNNNEGYYMYRLLFVALIILYTCIAIFAYNDLKAEEHNKPLWTPNWVQKPIQCAPLEQIAKIAVQKVLVIVWSGSGVANSDNLGVVRTDLFLSVNPETQEWSLLEVNSPEPEKGCLLGYCEGHKNDQNKLKLFGDEYTG